MTIAIVELRANAKGARASMNSALAEIFDAAADALEIAWKAHDTMTDNANAEGLRAFNAEVEVRELRAKIEAHNRSLKISCDAEHAAGHCLRSHQCLNCPREWEIETK